MRLIVDDGDQITWEEFAEANRDGMDEAELAGIRRTIDVEGVYHGGGGALAEFTIAVRQ